MNSPWNHLVNYRGLNDLWNHRVNHLAQRDHEWPTESPVDPVEEWPGDSPCGTAHSLAFELRLEWIVEYTFDYQFAFQ